MKYQFALICLSLLLASCVREEEQKTVPVTNTITVPTNMTQSPDGTLSFKDNYLREKSDKDVNVTVTEKKIDTIR